MLTLAQSILLEDQPPAPALPMPARCGAADTLRWRTLPADIWLLELVQHMRACGQCRRITRWIRDIPETAFALPPERTAEEMEGA